MMNKAKVLKVEIRATEKWFEVEQVQEQVGFHVPTTLGAATDHIALQLKRYESKGYFVDCEWAEPCDPVLALMEKFATEQKCDVEEIRLYEASTMYGMRVHDVYFLLIPCEVKA